MAEKTIKETVREAKTVYLDKDGKPVKKAEAPSTSSGQAEAKTEKK